MRHDSGEVDGVAEERVLGAAGREGQDGQDGYERCFHLIGLKFIV